MCKANTTVMATIVTTQNQAVRFDQIRNGVKTGMRAGAFAAMLVAGYYVLFYVANVLINLLIGSLPADVAGLQESATVLMCAFISFAALTIPTLGFCKDAGITARFAALIAPVTGCLLACMFH